MAEAEYHSNHAARNQSALFTGPEVQAWKSDAACVGSDLNWFAERGEDQGRLREVCAVCPVRTECLEYALTNHEFGFWGGASERQRRRLQKSRNVPRPVRHGTTGYSGGCRCAVCRAAKTLAARRWRERKRLAS